MGLKKIGIYLINYSGFIQRRVALAKSYSSQPELFLLDEPFVSLDEKISIKFCYY